IAVCIEYAVLERLSGRTGRLAEHRAGGASSASRLRFGVAVAQSDRAIEDEPLGRAVGVATEVALPLELHGRFGFGIGERGLELALAQHLERVGIEVHLRPHRLLPRRLRQWPRVERLECRGRALAFAAPTASGRLA